jgi:hypothetical protein
MYSVFVACHKGKFRKGAFQLNFPLKIQAEEIMNWSSLLLIAIRKYSISNSTKKPATNFLWI